MKIKLNTHLLSGAGNTFHIAYNEAHFFLSRPDAHRQMSRAAAEICRAHPADGFIFLEDDNTTNRDLGFKWYFFNNDGSDAEMCGNATRCVGAYVKDVTKSPQNSWKLMTVAGPIEIFQAEGNQFCVVMSPIQKLHSALGFFCDTGVPHLVLPGPSNLLKNLDEKLKIKSRELRFHPEFGVRGSNVTYVEFENEKNKLKAVSYERGVENFTAACGTGAMAAAFYNLSEQKQTETLVEMPGGVLKMNLENLDRPMMTGPAVIQGSYTHEITI